MPDLDASTPAVAPADYELRLRGAIGPTIRSAFPRLWVCEQRGETILRGPIVDQADLFGVLHEVESLGLHLLELRRLP